MRSQGLLTGPTTAASPWIRNFDNITQTPWLYNPTNKQYISYDDPVSIGVKTQWAISQNLAGLFCWSVEQDNGELLAAMKPILSGNVPVTSTSAVLTTTTSAGGSSTTSVIPTTSAGTTTTVTKTTTTATATPTSGSGKCAGIATWNASTAYNGGAQVQYQGSLYKAQWWTQGETPVTGGPAWSTWQFVSAC